MSRDSAGRSVSEEKQRPESDRQEGWKIMAKVHYVGRAVNGRRESSWEKECNAITREKSRRRRRRRIYSRLVIVLAVVVPAWGGLTAWHVWRAGVADRLLESAQGWMQTQWYDNGMALREVEFSGLEHLQAEAVIKAAGLDEKRSLLSYSMPKLREAIEAMPEVRTARVTRIMPDRLKVTIEERRPFAVWQRSEGDVWLDCDGTQLSQELVTGLRGQEFLAITGEDAQNAMPELCQLKAQQPQLAEHLAAAQMIGKRRLNIWLRRADGGLLEVMLPEGHAPVALQQLQTWMDDHSLLAQPVERLDMRLADRVFIKMKPAEDMSENAHLRMARAGSV
jgi:cell division protein FtsQ